MLVPCPSPPPPCPASLCPGAGGFKLHVVIGICPGNWQVAVKDATTSVEMVKSYRDLLVLLTMLLFSRRAN